MNKIITNIIEHTEYNSASSIQERNQQHSHQAEPTEQNVHEDLHKITGAFDYHD